MIKPLPKRRGGTGRAGRLESCKMDADPQQLLSRLTDAIAPRRAVLCAYSGGVDSTVVAAAARRALGKANAPAAIGDSPSLPRRELAQAIRVAQTLDVELMVVAPGEQADAGYQANAGDRCYFCKTHLYAVLQAAAAKRGVAYIANGTNTDDLGDHRPGLRAADEAQVISPLVEARIDKAGVRAIAQLLGLPNADKPAAACLASRIPYGTAVTPARLAQVEAAEDALHALGFSGFRVRHHDQVARLEVPLEQVPRLLEPGVRQQIVDAMKQAGFTYVALDMEGFRSGSGNAVLTVGATAGRGTA